AGIDAAGAPSWAAVALSPPAESALALALLGVVAGLPAHALPGRSLALCALLPIIVPAAERPALGSLRVTVLDVGHGLAVIVETARRRLLYDAGPRFPSGFDIGEDVAVPVLRQRPGMLDLLVLSHADND